MRTSNVRRSLLRIGGVLCLLVPACQPPVPRPSVVGIYWDLVATGTASRVHPAPYVNGHAKYSFRFTPDSVYRYVNATEREVMDYTRHSGDVIHSYHFTQRNDSLFFDGQRYRIASLRRDSLVLSNGAHRRLYVAARDQQKVERKSK